MLKMVSYLAGAAVALGLAAPAALAQPIAVADGEQAGVRIEITELQRSSGDTLMLKFTLVNKTEESINPYGLFDGHDLRQVNLIDAAGRKKYLPIMDAQNNCVCSSKIGAGLAAGESMNLWARFPAPPAGVEEVSVVFPHFIPADAPVSE